MFAAHVARGHILTSNFGAAHKTIQGGIIEEKIRVRIHQNREEIREEINSSPHPSCCYRQTVPNCEGKWKYNSYWTTNVIIETLSWIADSQHRDQRTRTGCWESINQGSCRLLEYTTGLLEEENIDSHEKELVGSAGRFLYQVKWYGNLEKTGELFMNLRHSMILRCHDHKLFPLPQNLEDAMEGKNQTTHRKGDREMK